MAMLSTSCVTGPHAAFLRLLLAQPVVDSIFRLNCFSELSKRSRIRSRLRQWNIDNWEAPSLEPQEPLNRTHEANNLTRPEFTEALYDDSTEQSDDLITQTIDQLYGPDQESANSASILTQGDMFEQPTGNGPLPLLAVYLKYVAGYHILLSQSGALFFHTAVRAQFLVKGFCSSEELEPILEFLPKNLSGLIYHEIRDRFASAVPRRFSKYVVDKLSEFQQESQDIYRNHSEALENAHKSLAHPTEARVIHLEEAAAKLIGGTAGKEEGLSEPLLHAVSSALTNSVFGFKISTRSYVDTRYLWVEPQSSAKSLERVQQSVRAYREQKALIADDSLVSKAIAKEAQPLKNFVKVARELISESRKFRFRSPDGFVVGTIPEFVGQHSVNSLVQSKKFTKSDLDFIHIFMLYDSTKTLSLHPSLRTLPSSIARSTGMYPKEELDTEIIHSFLVEIGVMQPHTDPLSFRNLLLSDGRIEQELGKMQARLDAGEDVDTVANLKDSVSHIRRDWSDMPIFAIDSPGAEILEDGLSLEECPGSIGDVWIHAHIASPTAFLDPNGTLSKLAANRVETTYLPDCRLPMFPSWFSRHFSLKADCSVLTFSSLLNSAGDLLDYKIQHGIARNIKVVTNTQVDTIFGFDKEQAAIVTYTAGSGPSEAFEVGEQSNTLSTDEIEILQKMMTVSKSLHSRRFRNPFASLSALSRVSVSGQRTLSSASQAQDLPSQPNFSLSEPNIHYSINQISDGETVSNGEIKRPSTIIVSAQMLLAGEVAAKWAAYRQIPVPYVGSRKLFDSDGVLPGQRKELEAMFTGQAPHNRHLLASVRQQYAMRNISPRPSEWRSMGLSHYTKATSPLRRYYDLLVHWQIDAAILEESRMGQSLVLEGSKEDELSVSKMTPACLPFSFQDMKKQIDFGEFRSKDIADFSRAHLKHLRVQVIARAHYLGQPQLPEVLTAHFNVSDNRKILGIIDQLDIACEALDHTEVKRGERWQVKIEAVFPASKRVSVMPVRKLRPIVAYMDSKYNPEDTLGKAVPT